MCIWCRHQYRRGVLTQPILARCRQIMTGVCQDFNAELAEFNGEHDHVHLMHPLSAHRRTLQARKLPQRRFQPHSPQAILASPAQIPLGDEALVSLLLRRLLRRPTTPDRQPIHRLLPALNGQDSALNAAVETQGQLEAERWHRHRCRKSDQLSFAIPS